MIFPFFYSSLEPYLELFEVWEIMVRQIIITIIANVIILTIFPVLGNLTHMMMMLITVPLVRKRLTVKQVPTRNVH